ncbi:mucin-3B-like [Xenopus laevis]|uniref:Mucin-3B-like n=1 Tax=Xenopus laevis TaxID=8355 RepID=A0A8J1MIJ8_XENLA|nr:mucin-3B-like [Xenopus laevis]
MRQQQSLVHQETTKSPSSGGVNITDFTTGPTTTDSSSSTDSTTREDNTHTTSSIPADKTTEARTRDKTTANGNNVTTAGVTTTDKPATEPTTEDSSSSTDNTTSEDNTHTTSSIPADKTTEATTRDKTTANGNNVTTAGATTTDKPATTTEGATTTESSLITGITTSEDNTRTNSSAPAVTSEGTTTTDSTTRDDNTRTTSSTTANKITAGTTATVAVTSEGLCVGEECLCPVNLYGQKCQFIQNEIKTEKVIIKLGVSVRVTNHEFDLELSNNLSEAYRSFEKSFNQQMEDLYRNISNYKGIRISSIKNGSVIVEHNILVEVNFVTRTQEYEDACTFIRATLSATTCTENNGMCFSAKDTDVCRQGINVPGLCSEVGSIPKEMQQYFYGLERGKALLCVTPCSTLSPQPVQCIMGQCLVSESGPSCYCDTSGRFWYTGDRCQTVINKAGVYGGVAVGLAVLLIVIVALSISLHKQHKSILLYKRRSSGSYDFGWEKHRKQSALGKNPDFMDSMWGPAGTFQANKGTSHVRLK